MAQQESDGQSARQKWQQEDFPCTMPPHQTLETLLSYLLPADDANALAHDLLRRFDSYSGVLDASFDALLEVDGVDRTIAGLLKSILPAARAYQLDRQSRMGLLCSPEAVGYYLADWFEGRSDERAVLLSMDAAGHVLAVGTVAQGDLETVGINARQVAALAVKQKGSLVALAHNHPSGVALPSENDLVATRAIAKALRMLHIQLIDHIIVADDDFVSLAQSREYAPLFDAEPEPLPPPAPREPAEKTESDADELPRSYRLPLW